MKLHRESLRRSDREAALANARRYRIRVEEKAPWFIAHVEVSDLDYRPAFQAFSDRGARRYATEWILNDAKRIKVER